MHEKRQVRWSKLAIASLICGILNLGATIVSILAICFGYMARKQIKESKVQVRGLTFAIIGICLGVLSLVWQKSFAYAPRCREQGRRGVCITHLHEIGEALYLYAIDYDGYFPPELTALYPDYIENPRIFWCPSDKNGPPLDITNNGIDALNSALISYQYNPGHKEGDSTNTPILWDNGCETLQDNHGGDGGSVLYLDGRVDWLTKGRWKNSTHGKASCPHQG